MVDPRLFARRWLAGWLVAVAGTAAAQPSEPPPGASDADGAQVPPPEPAPSPPAPSPPLAPSPPPPPAATDPAVAGYPASLVLRPLLLPNGAVEGSALANLT